LAVLPISPGTLSSGNTLEVNCLNYQTCIEKIVKKMSVYIFILSIHTIL
jgi:hypothetical protein